MVRLADSPDFERERLLGKLTGPAEFGARSWVKPSLFVRCRAPSCMRHIRYLLSRVGTQ